MMGTAVVPTVWMAAKTNCYKCMRMKMNTTSVRNVGARSNHKGHIALKCAHAKHQANHAHLIVKRFAIVA
jgi:hypothetical protein